MLPDAMMDKAAFGAPTLDDLTRMTQCNQSQPNGTWLMIPLKARE